MSESNLVNNSKNDNRVPVKTVAEDDERTLLNPTKFNKISKTQFVEQNVALSSKLQQPNYSNQNKYTT